MMWCSGLGWGWGAVCDVVQWVRLRVGRSVWFDGAGWGAMWCCAVLCDVVAWLVCSEV